MARWPDLPSIRPVRPFPTSTRMLRPAPPHSAPCKIGRVRALGPPVNADMSAVPPIRIIGLCTYDMYAYVAVVVYVRQLPGCTWYKSTANPRRPTTAGLHIPTPVHSIAIKHNDAPRGEASGPSASAPGGWLRRCYWKQKQQGPFDHTFRHLYLAWRIGSFQLLPSS